MKHGVCRLVRVSRAVPDSVTQTRTTNVAAILSLLRRRMKSLMMSVRPAVASRRLDVNPVYVYTAHRCFQWLFAVMTSRQESES